MAEGLLMRALSSRDAQLAGAGAVTAIVALALAVMPPRATAIATTDVAIAVVSGAAGEARRRPAATLGWRRLVAKMNVFDGDSVFVPPGSELTLRFDDGTELSLDERSLVVLERPRSGLHTLQLRQGAVTGRVGQLDVEIQTPAGVANLAAQTEARVEFEHARVEVSVKKGRGKVTKGGQAKALAKGERAVSNARGVETLAPWPVELKSPDANQRRVFRGSPGQVVFSWEGSVPAGARLQNAHDRLFAFVERDVRLSGRRWVLEQPSVGVTWWRVVDERGEPISEARRFSFVEDVAPAPMQPRAGEVVMAPGSAKVSFAWTPLAGVARYRLEISASPGFEPIGATFDVASAEARVALALPEGVWYWRARAADGDEPGQPSPPTSFRLIHKSIPDAPELLNPVIEVEQ